MTRTIGYIYPLGYLRCVPCGEKRGEDDDGLPIYSDGGWDETCDDCGGRVVSDKQKEPAE